MILLLDDFHLSDDASLAVLHLMMRRSQGQPIMVLFATRLDAPEPSPQASRLRESAERLGIGIIELSPMNEDESAELLASFIPEDEPQPAAAAARALLRAAAGYPMVLELLVQDWKANGERSVALSVDAMTADPAAAGSVKSAYHQLLDRLTASLDPATRNVLTMAALLGGRLNNLPSYALADLARGQTMSGMAELVRLRILRERGDRLEFANELIRTHVYMTMPSPLRRQLHAEVAGQLLAEAADGTMRSGLEIAWHCIRGGRRDEGIPYLLSGAREALRSGSSHEVELALTSALRELDEPQKDAANLLLAEALQEQGRPIDSLKILEELNRKPCQAGNEMIEVLSLSAHQRLADFDEFNADEAIARLKAIVTSTAEVPLKARALTVAALLVHDLQLHEPVDSLLELSTANWPPNLDEETAVRLVVARALLRQVNGIDGSLAELATKVAELRTSQLANLAAVQLVHCLSAANCSRGNYAAGLENAHLAQQMAVRIGNDLACAAVAANLALCYGRLGKYAEQGKWATWGQQFIGKTFVGYREIRLGLTGAFSSAMLGLREPAVSALDRIASRIPAHTAPWIVQAWKLGKADVLRLCGLKREAIREADSGIGRDGLLNAATAGPYARWLVALALAKRHTTEAELELRSMRDKLHMYEALDQVEILASELLLLGHIGKAAPAKLRACQRRIEGRLSQFPIAVSQQLNRLGALAPNR